MASYSRLPSVTRSAHIARAISFNDQPLYLGIGRTTPWEDENDEDFVPPLPDIDAKNLDELIGMKRITVQYLVYPDEDGDIIYRNRRWAIAHNVAEALENGANYVYLETTLEYDELPLVPFRQIGIFSNVTINPSVATDAVVPTETVSGETTYGIDDVGILEVIDNRKVVNRAGDSSEKICLLLEL